MSNASQYLPLYPYLPAFKHATLLAQGELLIDNFAGIGGASLGIRWAAGRPVDWAINHDAVAVSLHRVNEPHSHHAQEDVWHVDPRTIVNGQSVALAWFSPTCTHFSKAKGSPLVDKKIRGLAWVAVRYAATVRPRIIILENVEEFRDWGPITWDGFRIKSQIGRTFNSFVNALRYQGYEVEWRELRACDYGTPTIRKRLFLVARCDGLPIVWPEPTHADPKDPRVKAGLLQPFRTAAECIDWSLPCPSIFTRRKALVNNTLNRVAQGTYRYVLSATDPFVIGAGEFGQAAPIIPDRFRGRHRRADQPTSTITTTHNKNELLAAELACVLNKQYQAPARSPQSPLSVVTTNHNKNELLVPQLVTYYGPKREGEVRGQNTLEPLRVQTTENRFALVAGCLIKTDNQRSRTTCTYTLRGVTPTLVTSNNLALTSIHLLQQNGGKLPPKDASWPADRPTRTVMAQGGRQDLVSGVLVACGGRGAQARPKALTDCMHTVTGKADMTLTTAFLQVYQSSDTKKAKRKRAIYRGDAGQHPEQPLRTVTTKQKWGPVEVSCTPALTTAQLKRARGVHDLLTTFLAPRQVAPFRRVAVVMATKAQRLSHPCPALAPFRRVGLIVLTIHGQEYVLADIGLRMLTPRELARCQGFPEDFVLEEDAEGKPITKERQVRGIGNSVCPQVAEALARAQLSAVREEAAD